MAAPPEDGERDAQRAAASRPAPRAPSAPGAPWGIVPARRFTDAKSRLAAALDPRTRAEVARAMLGHVLGALAQSGAVERVIVISDGPEVAAFARERGAEPLVEDPAPGLALTVERAIAHVTERGATAALVLLADLPRLAPDEIVALAQALESHDAAVAPDRHRVGVNALAVALPAKMRSRFGGGPSLSRHVVEAEAVGARLAIVERPGLAGDVDEADDLDLAGALLARIRREAAVSRGRR